MRSKRTSPSTARESASRNASMFSDTIFCLVPEALPEPPKTLGQDIAAARKRNAQKSFAGGAIGRTVRHRHPVFPEQAPSYRIGRLAAAAYIRSSEKAPLGRRYHRQFRRHQPAPPRIFIPHRRHAGLRTAE